MRIFNIPFFGLDRQYESIKKEILDASDRIYSSGRVLDGDFTKTFEALVAKRCDRNHAVAVNSGTQALIFALRAYDTYWSKATHRAKVLIPGISYIATLNAVIEAGFEPIFCDVDSLTGLIDFKSIPVPLQELLGIVHVSLFGNCINYQELRGIKELFETEHPKTFIIEDAAQSFGTWDGQTPSGKMGDVSCLSFDPTKGLNNYGSGGMLLTDDHAIYEYFLDIRDNGKFHDHTGSGTNSKMSEVDCAHMIVKLKHFDQWQARRKEIAEYYSSELEGHVLVPRHRSEVKHSWSKYVIHHNDRNIIQTGLATAGIETKIHYPYPLNMHGVSIMSGSISQNDVLHGADEFCKTSLSLPIYPELTDEEVEYIVENVKIYTS